ncbi:proteobacterial dedicated sortase system histidine kinase [Planctobacterium marinum]|uniref:histidine kinase n=1 Tax=Planctobacterium marinum TaxID=1631968 RepID=A0AA48HGE7_9ALTE|nr:proteobacterial dedicated sortase system histidine kinase [Planctobacterium marinum]
MWQFRIGIRLKLLLLSSFLFAIPWLGYKYMWELENYLLLGQEQTLMGTARAVATALHERPTLFDTQASYQQDVRPGTDLYAHKILDPIRLDGKLADWLDYRHLAINYDQSYLLAGTQSHSVSDLNFTHMVGIYDDYLYAFFEVVDDQTVMRNKNSLRVDRNDFLHIAMTDRDKRFHRYLISSYTSGWVNAWELTPIGDSFRPLGIESRIQGHWQITEQGYNIELRIPLAMLSDKIAFEINDVDDAYAPQVQARIGTANPAQPDSLGTVLVPSPEIERIVKGLQHSGARVWVLDKHKRVMARSGDIFSSVGLEARLAQPTPPQNIWEEFEQKYLFPLYYNILTRPPDDFVDELTDAYSLEGKDIDSALGGKADSLWRLTPDNKAVILSAAHPVYLDDKVLGAVIVEQTTNGIRSLKNKALEDLFNIILLVMILGTLALFLFASRISSRIRKLRNQTEKAIDGNGKILSNIPVSNTQDEIGDLSRTFHSVLDKLQQYHNYLEKMASRLSHELRTPVAIVKSSMENLSLESPTAQQQPYIDRAQEGLERLSKILTNMSEAARLEHALQATEPEEFDLVALLQSCAHGYQLAYPNRRFRCDIQLQELKLSGAPDLFVQMLDKITANAVDFSPMNGVIDISLSTENNKVLLRVANEGRLLPDDMQEQLFDSMISVRNEASNNAPHLGLGLFIARIVAEYHSARIRIQNLKDKSGVEVLLQF